jgi:multiphosphoryl transfer protein
VIGIVVVSHSLALADAAVGLAREMVTGDSPAIAVAAGLDETTFGTDATAVSAAIEQVDGPDGVLVMLDLGSAVLSAEMALEFLDPDVQARVQLTSAPMVEGLVAAYVLAATGAPLDAVATEARNGLLAKQEHIGDVALSGSATVVEAADRVEIPVPNPHGLHARPAAKLVALVRSFDARVTLTNLTTGRGPVDAASLSLVATLDARQGHRLRAAAEGPDAEAALAAITDLAATGFGDLDAAPAAPVRVSTGQGSGVDVAIGPAIVPATDVDLSGYVAGDADTERTRSADAVKAVATRLGEIRDTSAEGAIFDAHLALLDDPEVKNQVSKALDGGTPAPQAWSDTLDQIAARFEGLEDPYQRARAQDIRAVRRRILAALTGTPTDDDQAGGILVVPELDPATAATVDPATVLGIATRAGGATGHGVIVAKSRGIPIITDVGDAAVVPGQLVAFDAKSRRFVAGPDPETERGFRELLDRRVGERRTAIEHAAAPAETTDGHRIAVHANVGSVADAAAAAKLGAEGSGLVRTEVLFGDRATAPSVDEQAEAFVAIGQAVGGPITIRTWDAGGDKPLPFFPQPAEPNPFLGVRGLRVFRDRPDLLRDQLAAVCRAATETEVRVMFPMVATAEELTWARGLVGCDIPVGIMVEVPAAALRIDRLAAGLDFVSIGTNDLTQYTLAADRGNAAVAGLADALDPAVLTLIRRVTEVVDDVAVCGDLAGDPDAAVLLAGLGVSELSAVGPQVPLVKARLRGVSLDDARALAARALTQDSAADVRRLLATL